MQPSTFIALHPFLSIPDMDPRVDEYGPYTVTPDGHVFGQAPIDRPIRHERAAAETAADRYFRIWKIERLRKVASQPTNWKAIENACGLTSHLHVQSALASIEMPDLASTIALSNLTKLTTFAFSEKLFFPTSGYIQSSMEIKFGRFFQSLGVFDIEISDELRLNEQKISVALLLDLEPLEYAMTGDNKGKRDIARICATDAGIECVANNSCFYTKIIMSRELKGPVLTEFFEGFWDEDGSW